MSKTIHKLYNGEVIIHFNDNDHSYRLETDELTKAGTPKLKRLKGVTSILGIIDKSTPLLYWQANIITSYIRENLDDLQKSANEILALAKEEANRQRDEAADIGSQIHSWIEQYVKGEAPAMPEDNNVLLGVTNFLEWVEKNNVKFLWSERIVYSKKYGYVGIADFAAEINGKEYLGDIKTGNAIYDTALPQTAAYLMATNEETKNNFSERLILKISKETQDEYIARMEKKGKTDYPKYKIFEAIFPDKNDETALEKDFNGFIYAMRLGQWQKDANKRLNNLKSY